MSVSRGGIAIFDLSDLGSYVDLGGTTQTYGVDIVFRTAGDVDVLRDIGADILNAQDPYASDPANCWVRCTFIAGNTMTGGNTLGVWHRCDVQRNFLMRHTTSGGSDEIQGNFDLELSSDASGSPITAQHLNFSVNVGELF